MATLKNIGLLLPIQVNALETLAGQFPETFALVCKNGKPTRFEFPIEDLQTVHIYIRKAGGRIPKLWHYDLSDHINEFDWEWNDLSASFQINRAEIEVKPGTVAIVGRQLIDDETCRDVFRLGNVFGGDEPKLGEMVDAIKDDQDLPWMLLTHFLINNPNYCTASDELPVERREAVFAVLENQAVAVAA